MKFGLLIIATEILEGKILDLNGRFLSDFLRESELELHSSMTVRDIESEIHAGLEYLMNSCDVIVTSGGLGPTKDDLTKDALGSYLGKKSKFSEGAHTIALENYERMGRPYPGSHHVYSQLPEGFIALSNSTGFAPALFCELKGKTIISAPGVPREFKSILNDHLKPWIKKNINQNLVMENVVIRTKKVPEEKIFGEVDPQLWDKLSSFGDVSSLPVLMGVDIGVKIRAGSKPELEEKKNSILEIIENSPIKNSVWHLGPEKLEEVIVAIANKKNITYGFAESCTGGLCSHRITSVPGSSKTFFGSVISYDTGVKTSVLEVSGKIIDTEGVVSEETAKAMAQGLIKTLGIDLAVSTTGIAGPDGGTEKTPVGTVCLGLATKNSVYSWTYNFKGDRELLKERFSQVALITILEHLTTI